MMLIALAATIVIGLAAAWLVMIRMPGPSFRGSLPAAGAEVVQRARRLEEDVTALAARFPRRNLEDAEQLAAARDHLIGRMREVGLSPEVQPFRVGAVDVANLIAEIPGGDRRDEIVVIGAHYDSLPGTPGADDNASGVAGLLELARTFARGASRTVRFALFVNEESPFFGSEAMGSLVYAKACRARGDGVVAMVSLEMLGYYRDEPGTQRYPRPLSMLYPDRGDFIAFVSDLSSRSLVRRAIAAFRSRCSFPSEGAALPEFLPGVGWSDHWAFWSCGYRAIMVTDTALFRNPHYHGASDLPATLDFARMARVVGGLGAVLAELASPDR